MSRTVWLTGLPGAGKSTLAKALEEILTRRGNPVAVLDGDELRRGLCKDLGYSIADRSENIRRVAEVARLLNKAGVFAITALISPVEIDRENARKIIGEQAMLEVYVSTPLEICESRDPKGLYKKARSGQVADFTGVGAAYEVPRRPALTLDTSAMSISACTSRIVHFLPE